MIIHSNTVIGADAFLFQASPGRLRQDVLLRPRYHSRPGRDQGKLYDRQGVSGDTVIGASTKMDNMVHVGHDTVIGRNCLFAAQVNRRRGDDRRRRDPLGTGRRTKDLTIGKGAVVLASPAYRSRWKAGRPISVARPRKPVTRCGNSH